MIFIFLITTILSTQTRILFGKMLYTYVGRGPCPETPGAIPENPDAVAWTPDRKKVNVNPGTWGSTRQTEGGLGEKL